jgi:hypothetical protein
MTSKAKKPANKLDLLPGLKWKGYLKILEVRKDGYVVQFTAQGSAGWVYDHAVLTAKQLKNWTGWSE